MITSQYQIQDAIKIEPVDPVNIQIDDISTDEFEFGKEINKIII